METITVRVELKGAGETAAALDALATKAREVSAELNGLGLSGEGKAHVSVTVSGTVLGATSEDLLNVIAPLVAEALRRRNSSITPGSSAAWGNAARSDRCVGCALTEVERRLDAIERAMRRSSD